MGEPDRSRATPRQDRKAARGRSRRQVIKQESLRGVHAEFARLLTGLDDQDLQFILNAEVYRSQIKQYVHETQQLVCVGDALEVPVVWLVSRHSRKHAFIHSSTVTKEHVESLRGL